MALGFYYYLQIDKKATVVMEDYEYPFIEKTPFDYQGTIVKRSISGIYKGTFLYELSSGQRFAADFSFLSVGDSVHRPANKDSICIFYKTGKQSKISLYREYK